MITPFSTELYYRRSTGGVLAQYRRNLAPDTATVLHLLMLLYFFVVNSFVFKIFFQNFFLRLKKKCFQKLKKIKIFKHFFPNFLNLFLFRFFSSKGLTLDASPFTVTQRTFHVSVLWKIWYAASGRNWTFVSCDVESTRLRLILLTSHSTWKV